MPIRWYQAKLAQRPLLTQSITTAVWNNLSSTTPQKKPTLTKIQLFVQILFATGDVMAQQGVERVGLEKHNFARTGRMALYGGAVFGPAATKWYQFLQHKIKLQSHNGTIAARVLADQVVFAPTNMCLFLSSMAILEGSDPKEKLRKSYLTGIKMNWLVWPWTQAINFKFVPLEHRVLVVNIVSLGWNCYLSWINSQK